MTIFGDSILKRVKLNKVTRVESNSNLTMPLQEERSERCVYRKKDIWEYQEKVAICKPRRQDSGETGTVVGLWSWTSSFKSYDKRNLCFINNTVSGN